MNRHVLVVDDDADTCASIADVLNDLGYEVDVAHDGESALDLARQRAYRMALLDFRLPGMSGVELFERLRGRDGGVNAFLVTAYASEETQDAAQAAGIVEVFNKPVDLATLLPRLEALMELAPN